MNMCWRKRVFKPPNQGFYSMLVEKADAKRMMKRMKCCEEMHERRGTRGEITRSANGGGGSLFRVAKDQVGARLLHQKFTTAGINPLVGGNESAVRWRVETKQSTHCAGKVTNRSSVHELYSDPSKRIIPSTPVGVEMSSIAWNVKTGRGQIATFLFYYCRNISLGRPGPDRSHQDLLVGLTSKGPGPRKNSKVTKRVAWRAFGPNQ
jgi:hypothetical protein